MKREAVNMIEQYYLPERVSISREEGLIDAYLSATKRARV